MELQNPWVFFFFNIPNFSCNVGLANDWLVE
jgi:hypothetical protein